MNAINRNNRPNSSLTTATVVEDPESGSSAPLGDEQDHDADDDQAEHPADRECGPLDRARAVPSMRMTAMIGTGLSATPTADGEEVSDRLAHRARKVARSSEPFS